MKLNRMPEWLSRLTGRGKKKEQLRILSEQRHLLHQGIETSAEVLSVSLSEDNIGRLHPVRIWLKLRQPGGTILYTHAQTLVTLHQIPCKGQTLRIKYLPENLSQIIIL